MAKKDYESPDPEDMFAETRMSFGDHIEDLRTHLLRAIKGLVIGVLIGMWPLGQYVMHIIVAPVEEQLEQFEKRNLDKRQKDERARLESSGVAAQQMPTITVLLNLSDLEHGVKKEKRPIPVLEKTTRGIQSLLDQLDRLPDLGDDDPDRMRYAEVRLKINDPVVFNEYIQKTSLKGMPRRLSTMNITEAFMVYFKVAIMTGLVISSPWVFTHIWAFIAAGLYPHEKKIVNVYLPFSIFLFLCGVLICQFMVMPKAIEAMLWFNEWLGLDANLRLNEWLSFALMMPIVFGLSFQTPLVMMFFHKVGLLSVQTYREKRRISWFVMAVFAAVITPSVDPGSMLFLWVPMGGLYELGILLCVWQGEKEAALAEWEQEEKSNELVEV